MTNKYNNDLAAVKVFMWAIVAFGFVVFFYTVLNTDFHSLDAKFLFIAVFTIAVSSRIVVDIPAKKLNVSVSDAFIFLTGLLFSYEAAILVAVVEAFITSLRFTKQIRFRAFNAGAIAISLFTASLTAKTYFDGPKNFHAASLSSDLVVSFGIFVSLHYLVNTAIVAKANSLRTEKSYWETWRDSYLWMSISCLASGSVAFTLAIAVENISFIAIILGAPILGIIYFSYRNYQGKLEISIEQAEDARKHLLEMQASEERFRGAFGQAPIGMALVSKEGEWLQVNDALCKLSGYSESELVGADLQTVIHTDDLLGLNRLIGGVLKEDPESLQTEIRLINRSGSEVWIATNISTIRIEKERSTQLIFQIQDVTDRRAAEEKLRHAAFYDSLTDLANRAYFLEASDSSIEKVREHPGYGFALVFMDLDRFKIVNDSVGHIAGDELLKMIARKLRSCLAPNHTIARLSGDEFTVLLDNVSDADEVGSMVEELRQQVSANYVVNGHNFFVHASMGVVIFNSKYRKSEDLLRDADTALHEAKAQGGARHLIFDEAMHNKIMKRLKVESDLKVAVKENQFFMLYQPIISLETNRLAGFEALVRWEHPQLGLINPDDFIKLSEETGDIIEIGKFVIEDACRQLSEWQLELEPDTALTMSVNVSAKQLAVDGLFKVVSDALEMHKIRPHQLKLEVTETAIVDNIESATLILKQIRLLGVKISMDDFGTGYSSMSYLHKLPITTLKIDRSFVMNMEFNREAIEIVHTIIILAKNLNLDVIAEGVETQEQKDILNGFDCDYGQGYLFSKPVRASEALIMIRELRAEVAAENNSTYPGNFIRPQNDPRLPLTPPFMQ
jgi:diguanylate cyclase (GGDEF)-like protein/PAS domain S-box-containing protein